MQKKLVVFGVTAVILVAGFVVLIVIFTLNSDVKCGSKYVSSSELGRYTKVISIN